jgi:hypothetical protein
MARGTSLETSLVRRLLVMLAGIVLGQCVLYGPSLIGRKILLPLDILAQPSIYLPQTPEVRQIELHNRYQSDLIYVAEPFRRFAVSEIAAGRLPMWTPWNYAGAPFFWPKFSPFLALESCTASPIVLAWAQLFIAVVAGLGAYIFCRRVLALSFWPAAIAAWCYPLTGFFVFWQGYPTCLPVVWLPWLLVAVHKTLRGTSVLAPIGLSALTCLVLISGQLDIAAQVLLGSGLYAAWCLLDVYRKGCPEDVLPGDANWELTAPILPTRQRPLRKAAAGIARLSAGWALGFLLAAPYLLPVLEYSHTGARMARRTTGQEERPPVGVSALPQIVVPDIYGASQADSVRFDKVVQSESSAAAYTGVLATLLLAPLAWCSRRHRSATAFFALLAVFSLSWCLNIPGFVQLLRLPGLNMMSHNRLVFLASFAILAMATIGLEALRQQPVPWRRWFWLPAAILASLSAWNLYRVFCPPERIKTALGVIVAQGGYADWVHDMAGVARAQRWFIHHYAATAVLCATGLAGWLLLRWWRGRQLQWQWLPFAGALLLGDLLWFACGRSTQSDPALYFPPIPVLDQVARSVPGRIIGANCLPASLAFMCSLHDIRGYDGVDPARLVALAVLAGDLPSGAYRYARMQMLIPKASVTPEGGIRLSPILDMLGVRYVIFRGAPPANVHASFEGTDYWALVNSNALPRAFVPHRVEVATDEKTRLAKLAAEAFDPREVAYVESPVALPSPCRGTAQIVDEIPTRIRVSLRMETAGLVVLADLWDKGWQAYLDGRRVPILRTDHAVRGVVVPAGNGTLEFRYAPASFAWGLRLAALAAVAVLVWLGIALRRRQPGEGSCSPCDV